MDRSDPNRRPQPLQMTRGKSPWGSGDRPPEGDEGKPVETAVPLNDAEPRNPWLNQDDDDRPRRSASIEDIFRQSRLTANRPKSGWIGLAIAGLVTAWLVGTSVHLLDRDERALVMTFGRYSKTIGPGLNLTLPWPMQSLVRRNVGADEVIEVPERESEALMLTRDGELIDVSFRVRWRIADFRAFAFNLPQGEAAIRRLADAQVRAAVAELPFNATFSGESRGQLQLRAAQRMQRVLDGWRAGLVITGIELVKVGPPARLADTFQKISQARDDARRQRENDEAWHQQQLAQARKEAAEFERVYTQYKAAPAVTKTKMYYETMERILRNNAVVLGGTNPATPTPAADASTPAGK